MKFKWEVIRIFEGDFSYCVPRSRVGQAWILDCVQNWFRGDHQYNVQGHYQLIHLDNQSIKAQILNQSTDQFLWEASHALIKQL